jgi:hypothetical protein
METKNNTENTSNCPICNTISNYNLKKWPPTEDKKSNTLNIEYICPNDHEFAIETKLKTK